MVKVTDRQGSQWKVRRQWGFDCDFELLDDDDEVLGALMLVIWPFWFAAHWFGLRWVIVVERGGIEVGSQRVRGWAASRRRMRQIAESVADGTWQPWSVRVGSPLPGQPRHLAS